MKYLLIALLFISFGAAAQTPVTLYGRASYDLNGSDRRIVWHNGSDSIMKIRLDSIVAKKILVGNSAYVLTANTTPTTLQTITIADETSGYIEVFLAGKETGTAGKITGKKGVGYRKDGGTLTLDTPTDIVPTSATGTTSTATWTITTSGNNIIIQVTGISGNMEWTCFVIQTKI